MREKKEQQNMIQRCVHPNKLLWVGCLVILKKDHLQFQEKGKKKDRAHNEGSAGRLGLMGSIHPSFSRCFFALRKRNEKNGLNAPLLLKYPFAKKLERANL